VKEPELILTFCQKKPWTTKVSILELKKEGRGKTRRPRGDLCSYTKARIPEKGQEEERGKKGGRGEKEGPFFKQASIFSPKKLPSGG